MDKEFFLNGGIPPPLQFDHPFTSTIPTWHNLSSAMEIQTTRSPDCFLNTPHHNNSNTTTTANDNFESAMSSMASSPAASNHALSNDNYMIRELIGKLGSICNSTGNHHQPPYIGGGGGGGGGNCSNNNSSYSTPLSSPPKMGMPMPIMDHLVKENFPTLGKSVALSTNLPAMPSDPGFAERAARFSSFGSRSFNGRTTPFVNNNPTCMNDRKNSNTESGLRPNSKLQRICSFPALKLAGSQAEDDNNKVHKNESENCGNDQGEFCNSRENSSISGQSPVGENGSNRKRKAAAPKGKSKESQSPLLSNNNKMAQNGEDSSAKRSKSDEEGDTKTEENRGGEEGNKQGNGNQKPPEAPKDYIHVRARRGQATDSHSLAERVRREKISERMKLLQDLVPGCDKVTGKALMLDEIINYVQSLQRQVEFLSMKLSSVNPRLEFNVGNLFSKDVSQPSCSMTHPMYPIDSMATNHYGQSHQNPIQDSITTSAPCNMDPPHPTINHNHGLHLPSIDGFSNAFPQLSSLCQGDLQTIVQMGFGQKDDGFQPQPLHGSNSSSLMKIEF